MWPLYLVVVIICTILSAFFSASDLVYGMVDQDKLSTAAKEGNKKASLALKIAQDYEWSISSILFGPIIACVHSLNSPESTLLDWCR